MPITGNDYASEGYKPRNAVKAKDAGFEPTVLDNSLVQRNANMGQTVSMDSLASDSPSFTGKQKGFFSKFGRRGVSK